MQFLRDLKVKSSRVGEDLLDEGPRVEGVEQVDVPGLAVQHLRPREVFSQLVTHNPLGFYRHVSRPFSTCGPEPGPLVSELPGPLLGVNFSGFKLGGQGLGDRRGKGEKTLRVQS